MTPSEQFETNMVSYDRLYTIYRQLLNGRGPNELGALRRSMILFMCAAWEAYIEDEIESTFALQVSEMESHHGISKGIKEGLYSKMKNGLEKNKGEALQSLIWRLSGDGWKDEAYEFVKQKVDSFNTPKSSNIDDLHRQVFGRGRLSDHWYWKGQSAENSRRKLNDFISLRGEIAHGRLEDSEVVGISAVINRASFLRQLVKKSIPVYNQLRAQ